MLTPSGPDDMILLNHIAGQLFMKNNYLCYLVFKLQKKYPQARRAGANSKVNIYVSAVARHV